MSSSTSPITIVDIDTARGWLDAVEAALIATAMGKADVSATTSAGHGLAADDALAGRAALGAKFLAVGTPRTLGLVATGALAAKVLTAQTAYAGPRELRIFEEDPTAASAMTTALARNPPAARATSLREACACDIVVAAGPITIRREWIRAGTLVTALDHTVILEPALLAAAVVYDEARLAAVAAGLIDGRTLDEITILLPA